VSTWSRAALPVSIFISFVNRLLSFVFRPCLCKSQQENVDPCSFEVMGCARFNSYADFTASPPLPTYSCLASNSGVSYYYDKSHLEPVAQRACELAVFNLLATAPLCPTGHEPGCLPCTCQTRTETIDSCSFDLSACGRYSSIENFDARRLSYSCYATNSNQHGYRSKSPPEFNSTLACTNAVFDLITHADACPAAYEKPCLPCLCRSDSRDQGACHFDLLGCARFNSLADFMASPARPSYSCEATNAGQVGYYGKSNLDFSSESACKHAIFNLAATADACPASYEKPCLPCLCETQAQNFSGCDISVTGCARFNSYDELDSVPINPTYSCLATQGDQKGYYDKSHLNHNSTRACELAVYDLLKNANDCPPGHEQGCLACTCKQQTETSDTCSFDLGICGRYSSVADFDSRKLSYTCSASNSNQLGYRGASPPEYDSTLACKSAVFDCMSKADACPAGYEKYSVFITACNIMTLTVCGVFFIILIFFCSNYY
jgi:hypothetical protein